ncbi:MAG: ANTAR domain-containing protein [Clostridiales bacterium]|nr:ANTAR domain-containing protein [Clostridiales bacterium]
MDRIVIAFGNDNNRNRIAEILEVSGYAPRKLCKTGKEAIRAIRSIGGGIIICSYKLVDMTADDLCYDVGDIAMVLAVGSPAMLEMCENMELCKIPSPIKKNDLISSVRMLTRMREKKDVIIKTENSEIDSKIIREAKAILMEKCAMTEPEAHRFMQKKSMDLGFKMISTARLIISSYS